MTYPGEYLTPKEAAQVVRLKVRTLAKMRHQRRGPDYIKLGDSPRSRVRYPRTALDNWMNQRGPGHSAQDDDGENP